MKAKKDSKPRRRLLNLAILMALGGGALAPATASAATVTWGYCTNGYWDDPACWYPYGVPQELDNVIVGPAYATDTTVLFDSRAGTRWANTLKINSDAANTISFIQSGGHHLISTETVGSTGTGSYSLTGGRNDVWDLVLGTNSGSNGSYYLSGVGSLLAQHNEYIGHWGDGRFYQSSGTNTVNNALYLGTYSGSNGYYNLSGNGSLTANYVNIGGENSYGIFDQYGGTNTVASLYVGANAGGRGDYYLNAGSLSAGLEYIGNLDDGSFVQRNGTHSVSDTLYTGFATNGTYSINAGSLWAANEHLGYNGVGYFWQNGGTHTVNNLFSIGSGIRGFGGYMLNAGTLSATTEIIGNNGDGWISQNGGTHTVSDLSLGHNAGSSGTYRLNLGSLSAGTEYVGNSGNGAFIQSGGAHTVYDLSLGRNAGGTGSYTLSAGNLSAAIETIGFSGTGTFTQSGGTHAVSTALYIGDFNNGNGTYNLNGGSLSAAYEYIGSSGTGAFTQSDGTNAVGTSLYLGTGSGSSGSYNLSNGNLSAGSEIVGNSGSGIFTQTGGTNSVTSSLTLGQNAGSTGTYILNGGTLSVGSLGRGAGSGSFNFSAGTLNFTNNLTLGAGHLIGDAVVLTGVKALGVAGTTTLSGPATLTLDGGTFSTGSLVNNGGFAFNRGTFNLTGANLTIGAGGLFGSSAQFASDQTIHVTNTTTINSGSVLALNNSAFSSGATNNSGQIVLGGAISNLGGGALNNAGRISGIGQVSATLNNTASGEVRAALGNDMAFTGAGNTNSGRITLLGGSVDSMQGLTNASTGMITGRGTLATGSTAATGLTNQGNLALSGTSDIIGDVTNTGTGRIVVSGGATATFYDDVVHNGAEIRVSSGSQAVFFGAVSGAGAYTGTGTVFFEGDLRPGNSPALVSMGGDTTLGMFSHTTMELGGLARGLQYDAFDVTGTLTLDGALDVVLYDLGLGVFAPQAGDSFDLFAADTILGNFSSMSFAALSNPNLFWQIDLLTDYTGTTDVMRLSVAQHVVPTTPVPEPETYAMLLAGLGLMGFMGRRRRNRAV